MSVFYSFLHHPGFFCYMAKDNCKRRTGNVDEKEVGSREKKMNSPVLLARGSQCPPLFLLNWVDILLAQTHLAAIFCSDNEYQSSKKISFEKNEYGIRL
jgi:hypothetical protein